MTAAFDLRPAEDCGLDVVTLGEVMLRLDPGERRVRNTRSFAVSEGGGEYNVGRALRRCFAHRVAHVGAITDNEIGRLLEDLLLQGGVNLDHLVWKPADDVGRFNRTPLNFTERGFGVRRSVGVYDRAHSATAGLTVDDVDWNRIFEEVGVRWLHTGGIFAGLSASTFDVARAAMRAARLNGTVVSYDINYRPSLWRAGGGPEQAWRRTKELLDDVDVLFGVEEPAFRELLSDDFEGSPPSLMATPRRVALSASKNHWGAVGWTQDTGFIEGPQFDGLEILDRVGGGDGFAAGVIYGLLNGRDLAKALEYGLAHGALVMTTPGDSSMATLDDVESVRRNGSSAIDR